jgi:hypothetical protein
MLESAVGAAAPSPDRSVRRRSQCAFYTLHRTSHTLQPWRVRSHSSMASVIEPLSSHFMARTPCSSRSQICPRLAGGWLARLCETHGPHAVGIRETPQSWQQRRT